MAKRPVFISKEYAPFYSTYEVEFTYYSGFATVQKQKSIKNLHDKFLKNNCNKRIIEVSTKSTDELGKKLSAFNLKIRTKKTEFSVETAFQGSKVFEHGGPYFDLIKKDPFTVKKDPRLKNSGRIVAFNYFGRLFPTEPLDYFYNWLYINALKLNEDLAKEILNYDSFTDIEFNPNKSLNCQARACAIFVGLCKSDKLEEALSTEQSFLRILYPNFEEFNQLRFNQ